MSINALNWAWHVPLPTSVKIVLVRLADRANDERDMKTWPSIDSVAYETGLSPRSVRRSIKYLEDESLISVMRTMGRVSEYTLNLGHTVTPDTLSPLTHCHHTPDTLSPHPGHTVTPPLTHCHPPLTQCPTNHKKPKLNPNCIVSEPARTREKNGVSAKFAEFWEAYPVHEAKEKTWNAWRDGGLDEIADLIIADVDYRRRDHVNWQDGYIPHPWTYVTGKRWEDEIKTTRPTRGKGNEKINEFDGFD